MKTFSEKDFTNIENNIYSVGVELSIIASLIKFLDISMNDELDINELDRANLTALLKERINDINKKYNKIEYLLGV